MAKKHKIDPTFQLFTHNELEIKNALVNEARRLRAEKEFSLKLSSAMIYASITEYLTENLLENLRHIIYTQTYTDFAGIIFIDERGSDNSKTLGSMCHLLDKYSFPDKEAIINLLEEITDNRNNLFHNLAKTSVNNFPKLEEGIKKIQDDTETFIIKINTLYSGLQKILITPATEPDKI